MKRTDLELVSALLNRPLPSDLVAWWRMSCGVTNHVGGILIPPNYVPYDIDRVIDTRESLLETWVEGVSEHDIAALVDEPAGTPVSGWLPVWLPVAGDGGGGDLFVDVRSGPLSGCVMRWDKVEAAEFEPLWPSISVMLSDIADALEHGVEIDGVRAVVVEDQMLDWH
ncbi:SMI1/KNR4 family protein [Actinophytocola algeriensis]|uniref:Cell wall assembly regulator SMI1 n=1 Tax=Actinophytocola algeriensis TaxID=1768010 RepID=A0A7W7VJ49_9PSEU|nr:SMI1/KNR4 family protein [Actinophytocola algeriensis]MBB4911715.1 cell wall assembly regulator SMI1 [Actinophytocola algeriensis]MBE1473297.1 cell wall assembly regulator SMI1 [Actinophytocola algeriensis]